MSTTNNTNNEEAPRYTPAPNTTVTGRVVSTERARSSQFGNPRFTVTIESKFGALYVAKTTPNASLGYAIENSEYREHPHAFLIDGRGNIVSAKLEN